MAERPKSDPARQAGAETSALVGIYRRLVSVEARKAISRHTSPAVRNRVKKQMARTAAVAKPVAQRRTKAAAVLPDLSPLRARNANLAAVCEALDSAGVGYFCVRGRWDRSASVAVAAEQRDAAQAALREYCAARPGYVSDMTGVDSPAQLPTRSEPAADAGSWAALKQAGTVRLTWYHTDASGLLTLGIPYGCDVEFWTRDGDRLVAPRPNLAAEQVAADAGELADFTASDSLLTGLVRDGDPRCAQVRTRPEFVVRRPDDVDFPIDVVYTWVDGLDPVWLRRRAEAAGEAYHEEAASAARFISRDELRYSLRSVHQNLPWVRHVYLVTDGQTPPWLDASAPGLTVVDHKEIFGDPQLLPTFNSHAIESQLHHIEGLSEHFVYLNDDVFLGSEAGPELFFLANGIARFFPSPSLVPHGAPRAQDGPVSVAAMNNRVVLERRFGRVLTQKFKHAPHALRRSVLADIEAEFAAEHRRTAANRFRGLDDLSIASSLHHYHAFHTGRAVPGQLRYAYADLSHPDTATRLAKLLATRDRQAFCINDTVSTEADVEAQVAVLEPFLRAYFPVPSPYEKAGDAR